MLVDRHEPAQLLDPVPQLYAGFEPVLRELDRLLDDDVIIGRVRADLARRAPHTLTRGRPGTPVEVVLRLLVVKRLYGWSYEEVERFVADSLVPRQFCRVHLERVPDDTTLPRWARLVEPATLEALDDRVVALARGLKVTRGRKPRLDSTVVATTIHHPGDSGPLADGVRVVGRLLRRARTALGATAGLARSAFRTRTRSARRPVQTLHRPGRRKGDGAAAAPRQAHARLVEVARRAHRQGTRVMAALRARGDAAAGSPAPRLGAVLPLLEQVVRQTARRVLAGAAVPAGEELVSPFEPHAQVIVRHEAGKPVEFGRKLWLEEVEGGIVGGSRLLDRAGRDVECLEPGPEAHRARFGKPPGPVAADRGVASARNEARAKAAGVRRVAIPPVGGRGGMGRRVGKGRWFRRGLRFRAGIEGRISVLRRCYGLDRCRDHGEAGIGRWVGWGVVAANLERIARTVAARAA